MPLTRQTRACLIPFSASLASPVIESLFQITHIILIESLPSLGFHFGERWALGAQTLDAALQGSISCCEIRVLEERCSLSSRPMPGSSPHDILYQRHGISTGHGDKQAWRHSDWTPTVKTEQDGQSLWTLRR